MIPSGSNDPYALRRAASGIVAILADNDWNLDIDAILNRFVAQMVERQDTLGLPDEVASSLTGSVSSVIDFLTDRVVKELQDRGVRRDVINAVTKNDFTSTTQMFDSADALIAHTDDANFRDGVEGLTRIMRLTTKNPTDASVDPALFEMMRKPTCTKRYIQLLTFLELMLCLLRCWDWHHKLMPTLMKQW
ncbi:glycyl-tRNA synthetase subunit beta [Weissella viridescens]|uniref:glycine--tRNA ligase n=1 Tax=Weissella viridescens TaxID=1629 RepID=A0A380P812_WEIVI|nr:glycyl-tRNA synthetase subunit beta [Weissella viridescens]